MRASSHRALIILLRVILATITVMAPSIAVPTWAASQIGSVLATAGPLAEDSLYNCLLNAVRQGIPIQEAVDDCATKLLVDAQRGFGKGIPNPLGNPDAGLFDPASIVSACAGGDPRVAEGQTSNRQPPTLDFAKYGVYTWQYKGVMKGWLYYGLTEAQSREQKEISAREADATDKALKEAKDALDKAVDAYNKTVEDYNKTDPKDTQARKAAS
jgi:hypothetical protein